jgi:hypothetical protein
MRSSVHELEEGRKEGQGYFSFSIFGCSQTGDHVQKDLAKSGYRPDMKVKRF